MDSLFSILWLQLRRQMKVWLDNHRQLALAIAIISPAFILAFPFIGLIISGNQQPPLARAICFALLIALQLGLISLARLCLFTPSHIRFLYLAYANPNRISRDSIKFNLALSSPIGLVLSILLWANINDATAAFDWTSTCIAVLSCASISVVACYRFNVARVLALASILIFEPIVLNTFHFSAFIAGCALVLSISQSSWLYQFFLRLVKLFQLRLTSLIIGQHLSIYMGWLFVCSFVMPALYWLLRSYLSPFQQLELISIVLLVVYNIGFQRFNYLNQSTQQQLKGIKAIFGIQSSIAPQQVAVLASCFMLTLAQFIWFNGLIDAKLTLAGSIIISMIALTNFVLTTWMLVKRVEYAVVFGHFLPVLIGVASYIFLPALWR